MTHTSYAEPWERYDQVFRELRHCVGRPTFEEATPPPAATDNQRLEFLGDAVLEFICTSQLFHQVWFILVCVCVFHLPLLLLCLCQLPGRKEGAMSRYRSALVNNKLLAYLATNLGVKPYLLHSHAPALTRQVRMCCV